MKIIQSLAIALIALLAVSTASATAITLGTGEYWLNECTGHSEERSPIEAKGRCELMLFSYQMGAAMQAHETGQKPAYCEPTQGEISEQLVNYLKANQSELKAEFLDVIHRFSAQSCKAKQAGT